MVTLAKGFVAFVLCLAAINTPCLAEVKQIMGFEYKPGLKLDLYWPTTSQWGDSKPAAILIHGGGWTGIAEDRSEFAFLGNWIAAQGGVAIAVDYRLAPSPGSPGAPWPAQLDDVRAALWQLRHYAAALGVNPNKIVAVGGSAGGQLAGMLATTEQFDSLGYSGKVQAVVTLWAPWNLAADATTLSLDARNIIANLLDRNADGSLHTPTPGSREEASPYYHISAASAPALLIHGSADPLVPADQSKQACSRLQSFGVACRLLILPGEGHNLPQQPDNQALFYQVLQSTLNSWMANPQ